MKEHTSSDRRDFYEAGKLQEVLERPAQLDQIDDFVLQGAQNILELDIPNDEILAQAQEYCGKYGLMMWLIGSGSARTLVVYDYNHLSAVVPEGMHVFTLLEGLEEGRQSAREIINGLPSPQHYEFSQPDDLYPIDTLDVGPDKPMGYDMLSGLRERGYTMLDIETLIKYLKDRGLAVKMSPSKRTEGSALYAYDTEALQQLLDSNRDVLIDADWPTKADDFVDKVMQEYAPSGTTLYELVGKAFNDERFR